MEGYLITNLKEECTGCSACAEVCPVNAIKMIMDDDKFSYPLIDENLCIHCDMCRSVCPQNKCEFNPITNQKAFGGYSSNPKIREESTSGGAFSAIAETFCDENYIIFGAKSNGLGVEHGYVDDISKMGCFRKSKYVQSDMKSAFSDCKKFLLDGKKVLFSGTPCQIAGLKNFLKKDYPNLLTVEVVCEGVPTPYFIESYSKYIEKKFNKNVEFVDYRNKDKMKWDFEMMRFNFVDGSYYRLDRWFNPFWNIWLNHLMNRPSCYQCQFAKRERTADITLGDLWGVHLYCPDLYGKNGGSSLMVSNTEKGLDVINKIGDKMHYRELDIDTAIKYQSPMRRCISDNPKRIEFMQDVKVLDYEKIVQKWYQKPSLKLLYSKYIWGNRQKIAVWNFKQKFKKKEDD